MRRGSPKEQALPAGRGPALELQGCAARVADQAQPECGGGNTRSAFSLAQGVKVLLNARALGSSSWGVQDIMYQGMRFDLGPLNLL